jgi:plastocyanin
MRLGTVAAVALTALVAGPAAAPAVTRPARVSITDSKLAPAIVTIHVGGSVEWRNGGARPHGLRGAVTTPTPIPVGQTFRKRFPRAGTYHYALADNPDVQGTVIVLAGGGGPGRARGGGLVTHRYRGTFALAYRESYEFYDGRYGTKQGPCNNEIGRGIRDVSYRVALRNVRYIRIFTIENLTSADSPGHVATGHEHVDATVPEHHSPNVTGCQDVEGRPASDPASDQSVSCDNQYRGTPISMRLLWSARVVQGRFQFDNSGRRVTTLQCGPNFDGGLATAGVNLSSFPLALNVVADRLAWDEGNTSPATRAEANALRAGRAVTIRRRVDLDFTADCCNFWNPDVARYLVFNRNGAVFHVRGALTIALRPA